jgi:2-polyprenyl-3-methyl-5-hydroxy-6-metoxy-1,4-benzoquinol methylase
MNSHFVTSDNRQIQLLNGYRDWLKPWWRNMFSPPKALSSENVNRNFQEWHQRISVCKSFFEAYGFSLNQATVVEIGDSQGYAALSLAGLGASQVIATDIVEYYENQSPSNENSSALKANQEIWSHLCILGKERDVSKVSFINDDITRSSIPHSSADIICSWEVLEHILNPAQAFSNMEKILKPKGFIFHEYNPFFAIDGGHSLCTLDFPWGHARLTPKDFCRYISSLRPNEQEMAVNFYEKNLNRMSLSDLQKYIHDAGLHLVCLLPHVEQRFISLLRSNILQECQTCYPQRNLSVVDLISPRVWMVMTKEVPPSLDAKTMMTVF